jgi:hypothetical protein
MRSFVGFRSPGGGISDMTFTASWHTLSETIKELPLDAILRTPLSQNALDIIDVQESLGRSETHRQTV